MNHEKEKIIKHQCNNRCCLFDGNIRHRSGLPDTDNRFYDGIDCRLIGAWASKQICRIIRISVSTEIYSFLDVLRAYVFQTFQPLNLRMCETECFTKSRINLIAGWLYL